MSFDLPLAEQKVKPHQVTALHLLAALAFIGSGALFYNFHDPSKGWSLPLLFAGAILLLVAIFRNKWIVTPKVNRIFRTVELMILLSLLSYAGIHKWGPPSFVFGVLSAAVLFALFWEFGGEGSSVIHIDKQGFKLPLGSRKRFIAWVEIEHVLLKFGTLTVNCYDNRLYQWSLGAIDLNNGEFDEFCSEQIEEAKKNKDKNDW
jgi:hypothetical protein